DRQRDSPLMELMPIDPSLLPADVRSAGPAARKLYGASLGFERSLVDELAKQLNATTEFGGQDDGDTTHSSSDVAAGSTSVYKDMLPSVLSDAVTGAGGLGLAPDLYRALSARRGEQ